MKLNKEKLEMWYKQGLWNEEMILQAVEKGGISQEDAAEILGKEEPL